MRLTRFYILTLVAVMLSTGCGNEQSRALRALDNLQSVCRNVDRDLGIDYNTISAVEGGEHKEECHVRAQAAWSSWRRSFKNLRNHASEEWTLGESKRLESIRFDDYTDFRWKGSMNTYIGDVENFRVMLREVPSYVAATKEVIESARSAP